MTGLPNGWVAVPVRDVFDIIGGGTPSTAVQEYWDGHIPWISSADIDEDHRITLRRHITEDAIHNSATNKVPANSVIVVTRVGLGKVALAPTDLCFSQDSQALLFNPVLLEPAYVLHNMGQAVTIFKHISRGTTISGVTKKQLATLAFLVPPRAEQRRIVAEIEKQFTRLDAAVAALKHVQANLKRYHAAVLKAACEGRLVPTEAELARKEGRPYETGEQLLARILQERRAEWEADQFAKMLAAGKTPKDDSWRKKYKEPEPPDTSNLPPLPEGWTWATWDQIAFSQNGRPFPSKEYCQEGVKLLRPGNLHISGRVEWTAENTKYMPAQWERDNSDLIIGPGELIMNLTAQSLRDEFLGRVCLTGADEHCLLNQRLARLTPVLVSPRYLLWMFKSRVFRRFVDRLNTGSLIQHMFTSQLANWTVPLPPAGEQSRIVAEVEQRLSSAEQAERTCETELIRADRLRLSILKHAFEGKLIPQDPNDEPASVLLERIRAERAGNGISPETRRRPAAKARTAKVRT